MTRPTLNALIVDDNPGDADLVEEHLTAGTGGHCHLLRADTLASGLRLLKDGDIDALLLDLSLPDATGLDAVRAARTVRPEAPIIVLTGLEDEAMALAALREGAQDYLIKGKLDGALLVRSLRYATERKRAELALRRAEERMWQSQKSDALGKISGGVVHEVNNLMTVVTGFGDLLMRTLEESDSRRRELLGEMLRAANRTAEITRQIVAFGRRESRPAVILDLNQIVVGLRPMLRSLLGSNIELKIVLCPQPLLIKADALHVEQAILSVASAVRDTLQEDSQLSVGTSCVRPHPTAKQGPPSGASGSFAVVTITGKPTQAGQQPIQESRTTFFSNRQPGLGFAGLQGFLKKLGGEVAQCKGPDQESIYNVFLPLVGEPTPPVLLKASSHGTIPGLPIGKETILLADDEHAVLMLLRHSLESCGYTVLGSITGAEALDLADRHDGTIHLLLTDTCMPEMNGAELAKRLLARRPLLKVIFTSGFTEHTVLQQGRLIDGALFLQKPFTLLGLARKVREALDGAPVQPDQDKAHASLSSGSASL